ncbi:hypothetical protein ACFFRR_011065 [Megaselia abdita]
MFLFKVICVVIATLCCCSAHVLPAPHFDVHPFAALPPPAVPFGAPLPVPFAAPTIPFAAPAPVPVLPSPPLPTLALPPPVLPALPLYDPLLFAPTYKATLGPVTKTHTVSLGYAYPHLGKYVVGPHSHSHSHLIKAAPFFKDHHHHLFA